MYLSIGSKFGHQVALHALPHCRWLPYWHHQLVLRSYFHQPESYQLSLTNVLDLDTSRLIDRTSGTPGSFKSYCHLSKCVSLKSVRLGCQVYASVPELKK